jgi:hypothetical protein
VKQDNTHTKKHPLFDKKPCVPCMLSSSGDGENTVNMVKRIADGVDAMACCDIMT